MADVKNANIAEKIDTFETDKLVYEAKMSYGDMDEMAQKIQELSSKVEELDLSFQSLTNALADSVSAPKFNEIVNLANTYSREYAMRFTTKEMKAIFAEMGFENIAAVIVNEQLGNDAIENGRDVFAFKKGEEPILLEKCNDASVYKEKGYVIVVSPATYASEFEDDLDRFLDEN